MAITSIPHLGPVAAHRKKKNSVVPFAWHLPSVPVPGLTLSRLERRGLHLDLSATVSTSASSLSSPPLAVENGSLGTASESTSRETPLPQIVVIPSPLPSPPRPGPSPSAERAIGGFEPRRPDGVTGSSGCQASNMASPSICTNGNLDTRAPWANPNTTTRLGGMVRQTWNRRPPPPPEA